MAHCSVCQVTRYPCFVISAKPLTFAICALNSARTDSQLPTARHLGRRSPLRFTTSSHRQRKSRARPQRPRPPAALNAGEFMMRPFASILLRPPFIMLMMFRMAGMLYACLLIAFSSPCSCTAAQPELFMWLLPYTGSAAFALRMSTHSHGYQNRTIQQPDDDGDSRFVWGPAARLPPACFNVRGPWGRGLIRGHG